MPIKITRVLKGSIAEHHGICSGDHILTINGKPVRDFIDLQFHTADQTLEIRVLKTDNRQKTICIEDHWAGILGVEPAPHTVKTCCNNCIFCFIDQMPPGLRAPLYVKDDDYLYSFVFGNYISMNNLSANDFDRIVDQQISPLYVSVHTTDPRLRASIMGYDKEFNLLEKLRYLSLNGISFHTQIVLMPGINDGQHLLKTLTDITHPSINTLSVGIVPVGLTKEREGLPDIKSFTKDGARQLINQVSSFIDKNRKNNIYLADEFFVLASREMPDEHYYDDFCQIENGIGMICATAENFRLNKKKFAAMVAGSKALFITGELAKDTIDSFAHQINDLTGKNNASVLAVRNSFFGGNVTVSGLLTYQDIEGSLSQWEDEPDLLIVSNNMFNSEGYTIDDVHYSEFSKKLGKKVLLVNELWEDWSFVN